MPILSSPISGFSETSAKGRLTAWVTSASTNPSMGILRPGSYFVRAHVHVTVAFNSDGTDGLTVGYDADTDALISSVDVSTTGVKSVTLGVLNGYNGTARNIEAYYTAGGSAATAGKALVILEIWPVPLQP